MAFVLFCFIFFTILTVADTFESYEWAYERKDFLKHLIHSSLVNIVIAAVLGIIASFIGSEIYMNCPIAQVEEVLVSSEPLVEHSYGTYMHQLVSDSASVRNVFYVNNSAEQVVAHNVSEQSCAYRLSNEETPHVDIYKKRYKTFIERFLFINAGNDKYLLTIPEDYSIPIYYN